MQLYQQAPVAVKAASNAKALLRMMLMMLMLLLLLHSQCVEAVDGEFTIAPLNGSNNNQRNKLGVEVLNVDNIGKLSAAQFDAIHLSLLEYKVVVIREQASANVEDFRSFMRHFGKLFSHVESSSHLPGYTDVNLVSNIANVESGLPIGLNGTHTDTWHSDLSWAQLPTKFTALLSEIRPEGCGDTLFADSTAAYEALDSDTKKQVEGQTAYYNYLKHREVIGGEVAGLSHEEVIRASSSATHPLITTHPITGKKNVFANPSHTIQVVGKTLEESDQILQKLFSHVADPENIYTHTWRDFDMVIWDNRAVQHRATGCPNSKPRKLVRVTVGNDESPREDLDAGFTANADLALARDRVFGSPFDSQAGGGGDNEL